MSDIETNPYSAPSSEALPLLAPKSATGYFYRDGKYLVVSDKAELPPRCVLTNQPVDSQGWRKSVAIAWTPPWLFVTLLVGWLITVILILVLQKKAKITYSLSSEGRNRIRKKKIIGSLLLLVSVGCFFAGITMSADSSPLVGFAFVGGFATLISSLIFFIVANPVKAAKYRDGWFRVKGCSPEFLDPLPPMPNSPF